MNSQEIVLAVTSQNKSLVFLSRGFMESPIGTFVKDSDGNLTKVHGKSAIAARKILNGTNNVCRSYGKAKLTRNSKTKSVFMTEYSNIDFIV